MAAAIGFDVGDSSCVVAAVARRSRGVDVLLTDDSARETPTCLSFSHNHRLVGAAAAAAAAMSPTTSPSRLKRLIASNPTAVAANIPFLDRTFGFTPIHLMAMLLSHLKVVASKRLEEDVSACVVNVPCYFTVAQRRAYLDAAMIAGLRPLRLVHDVTATALGYGIYKNDISADSSIYVAFVDVGNCDTQVGVVEFWNHGMKVLAHAADAALGGAEFDEVLFRHFAKEFKEKYGIDATANVRASMRLRMACEKAKKVLSANAEAVVSIECLMEETDVSGMIKREEFEHLCAELLDRVLEPCKKAIANSGVGLEKLHSLELVGSGSRIPAISRVLSKFFGREPSRTLNASECVARGSALQCAMLSPSFRVKEYEVQDAAPHSIGLSLNGGHISTMSNNTLFRRCQPFPSVKVLTLHTNTTFNLEAFYADQDELPLGTSPGIASFQIGPFQSPSEKSKVKVKVRLNLHGVVLVESAALIEGEENNQTAKHGNCVDDMEIDTIEETGTSTLNDTGFSSNVNKAKRENMSKRQDLPIMELVFGAMSKSELLEAQEQEGKLAHQDKVMERTKERKNALEAYVYETRNKLIERYRSFASDTEREDINTNLQQTEDWLYEEGDDETEQVYSRRLEELKQLVQPIENRCKDEEARAEATRDLLKCIVEYRMAVQSLATYERDAVNNECGKAEQWLREKSQQQESLPKTVEPVLWSHEIKKRTEELTNACKKILGHKAAPGRTEGNRNSDHHRHS